MLKTKETTLCAQHQESGSFRFKCLEFRSKFLPLNDTQASALAASYLDRAERHYQKADALDPKVIQFVPNMEYSIQLRLVAHHLFKAAGLLVKAQAHVQAHASSESELNTIYHQASTVIYRLRTLGFNVYSHRCGVFADNVLLQRTEAEKAGLSFAFTYYDKIYAMAGRLAESVGNKSAASRVYCEWAEVMRAGQGFDGQMEKIREFAIKGYKYAPDHEKEDVAQRLLRYCDYDVKQDKFLR